MMVVQNARILSAHPERVDLKQGQEACQSCHETVAGICAPWGKTRVCAKSSCVLFAQTRDAKLAPLALESGPPLKARGRFRQYRGVGIAYKGNNCWVLGFFHNDNKESVEWLDNLTWEQVRFQLECEHRHIVRQSDEAIFGASSV